MANMRVAFIFSLRLLMYSNALPSRLDGWTH